MDHSACFPSVHAHTHSRTRSIYTRDLPPTRCEALHVTTTHPVRNLTCRIGLEPAEGHESSQMVYASVRPSDVDPTEDDVMLSRRTRDMLYRNPELESDLRCRILIWNCSGICHCKFREALEYINDQYGIDIAIVVGGPPHDESLCTFWYSLGLREGIPSGFNFEGSGPAVTVRYDETLMEVDYLGIPPRDDGTSELRVYVDRPLYIPAIEYALARTMDSSDETDSEADDSD